MAHSSPVLDGWPILSVPTSLQLRLAGGASFNLFVLPTATGAPFFARFAKGGNHDRLHKGVSTKRQGAEGTGHPVPDWERKGLEAGYLRA